MIYVYCSLGPLLELDRRKYQHWYIVFSYFLDLGMKCYFWLRFFVG